MTQDSVYNAQCYLSFALCEVHCALPLNGTASLYSFCDLRFISSAEPLFDLSIIPSSFFSYPIN